MIWAVCSVVLPRAFIFVSAVSSAIVRSRPFLRTTPIPSTAPPNPATKAAPAAVPAATAPAAAPLPTTPSTLLTLAAIPAVPAALKFLLKALAASVPWRASMDGICALACDMVRVMSNTLCRAVAASFSARWLSRRPEVLLALTFWRLASMAALTLRASLWAFWISVSCWKGVEALPISLPNLDHCAAARSVFLENSPSSLFTRSPPMESYLIRTLPAATPRSNCPAT